MTSTAEAGSDPVEVEARASFDERYAGASLGPICVIVPSYLEAGSIGPVLAEVPTTVAGLPVRTLVVVDGDDDGTGEIASGAGAFVCIMPENRGQGAVLRFGYRLATEHGARYLVSLDADGQYDPAEIPGLLTPIIDGEADFVSGSRRLGSTYVGDGFRRVGVVVYAALMRLLTGQRITDPSFGLRAMRSEVAAAVPLRQPQFQAAELLVGAACHGFRVLERPGRMRARSAGESRKGNDLVYGYRFGRVLATTWWRERRHRPRR
jgi:glycosyltransferase involved in cell wall biosynthesis